MTKNLLISMVVLLCSAASFADQCAYLPVGQGKAAAQIIQARGSNLSVRCDLCDDKVAEFLPAKSIEVKSVAGGSYETVIATDIHGKSQELDLAYTFVSDGKGGLENLADLVGCPYVTK